MFKTTDLCDAHEVEVLPLPWRHFGKTRTFAGKVTTLKVFEDNAQVRAILSENGIEGEDARVLLIDGAGSMRSALLGDQLADLGAKNGWAGVVIVGAVRDSEALAETALGVAALGTVPRKSAKNGNGIRGSEVVVAGVSVQQNDWIYCDVDGVIVARAKLTIA